MLRVIGDSGEHHPPSLQQELKLLEICTPNQRLHVPLEDLQKGTIFSPKEVAIEVVCVSAGRIAGRREVRFFGVPVAELIKSLLGDVEKSPYQSIGFFSAAPQAVGPKDEPHHTFLELSYALHSQQLCIVWQMEGKPLPYCHGGPLRTIVGPDRYFYKSIKWLAKIELRPEPISELRGTWEKYAGYHPLGRTQYGERFEPFLALWSAEGLQPIPTHQWQETFQELYRKGDLSKIVAAQLHEAVVLPKDFRHISFVSVEHAAEIRGTLFRHANFCGAYMEGVNLSLSKFPGTKFSEKGGNRPACLAKADLEGAVFVGAHLEGVHMEGAHLSGCRFYPAKYRKAKVAGLKLYNCQGLDPEQRKWLLQDGAIG